MPKIEIKGESAVFTLANGDVIRVTFSEGGCGVEDFSLKAMCDRGTKLVRPSSGNAVELMTDRALLERTVAVNQVVATRRAAKSDRKA